jgi:hypothetical protein
MGDKYDDIGWAFWIITFPIWGFFLAVLWGLDKLEECSAKIGSLVTKYDNKRLDLLANKPKGKDPVEAPGKSIVETTIEEAREECRRKGQVIVKAQKHWELPDVK